MTTIWAISDLHSDAEPFAGRRRRSTTSSSSPATRASGCPGAGMASGNRPDGPPIVYVPGQSRRLETALAARHRPGAGAGGGSRIHLLAEGGGGARRCPLHRGDALDGFRDPSAADRPRPVRLRPGPDEDRQRITTTLWGRYSRWLSRDAIASHRTHRAAIEAQLAAPPPGRRSSSRTMPRIPTACGAAVERAARRRLRVRPGRPPREARRAGAVDPRALHESRDYRSGGTRIVCNPRGYGAENGEFDARLTVTL